MLLPYIYDTRYVIVMKQVVCISARCIYNILYNMNMINLIHGDCLEEMKKLPDGSVDLTVTSPPYDNLRTYNGNIDSGMRRSGRTLSMSYTKSLSKAV